MRKVIVSVGTALLLGCGAVAVFLLARAALGGEGMIVDYLSRPRPTPLYTPYPTPMPIVEYSVTGTAKSVHLTYANATGGTEQIDYQALPWKHTFLVSQYHTTFVYLSAQNTGEWGTVTATIKWKGSVIKTATSKGDYVIASCRGTVP